LDDSAVRGVLVVELLPDSHSRLPADTRLYDFDLLTRLEKSFGLLGD